MDERSLPKWILTAALIALVVLPTVLAGWGAPVGSIAAVTTACIAAALLIRLPDVELFKVGPLEARLRRATEKAEATVAQLRTLAAVLARPLLAAVNSQGRMAGGELRARQFVMLDEVVTQLRELGLNDAELTVVTRPFYQYVGVDLAYDIQRIATHSASTSDEQNAIIRCFHGFVRQDLSTCDTTTLRDCLSECTNVTAEISEALDDLDYFKTHGTLRRRDVFIDRIRTK